MFGHVFSGLDEVQKVGDDFGKCFDHDESILVNLSIVLLFLFFDIFQFCFTEEGR